MSEAGTLFQAAVEEYTSTAVWAAPEQDLVEDLQTCHRVAQQLIARCATVARELAGRGVPAAGHAVNTPVWLRDLLRVSVPAGKRLAELGRVLDNRTVLARAVADGAVGVEQAAVIGEVLDGLPADLDPATAVKAETMLVEWAGQFDPKALRLLGRRIVAHVDPDAADRADAEALERANRRAHRKRSLTLSPYGDGQTRVFGYLDSEAAAIVNAALDPLCRPVAGDDRSPTQRRADALTEVCRLALHTETLPDNGGDRPHLVVTVPFDVLRGELGSGQLDTGETLTPEQVRRMACDARLMPVVMGGQGQVLDVGRSRRLFTGSLRRALILRDGGCAYPGCDRPAMWCDAHHVKSWAEGGSTDLDNSVLLCTFHHRVVHHEGWTVRIGADRLPEFIAPAHLDPTGTPQRNIYHRPDRKPFHPRT